VPSGRIVEAIDVSKDSKPLQRLRVVGMEPVGNDEQFFFGGIDINFDGLADLMLMTQRGVANAYADYWLFEPKTGMFVSLGKYPVFRIDSQRHRLSTFERNGSGGLLYEAKEFTFVDGKLVLMRDEEQTATGQAGIFRKVVRERQGAIMKTIEISKVQAPAETAH
jgi:hypothetical protein